MKTEDIDKRIGMPDVDAEWAQFEREVIGKDAKPRLQRMVVWTGGIGIAAAIALLFVLNMGKKESADQSMMAQQTEEQPLVTHPTEEQPLVAQLTEERSLPSHPELSTPAHAAQPKSSNTVPTTPSTEASNVYDCGEIMPRYPGGDKALLEFINANLRYPELALEYGAKGRVIIGFIVDTVGAVSDFRVVRSLLKCDTLRLHQEDIAQQEEIGRLIEDQMQEEALRVVSLLRQQPQWSPGELFGRRKNVRYNMPVRFQPTKQMIAAHESDKQLQRRIAGLDIVPSSDSLGEGNIIRLAGAVRLHRIDSFAVILNGDILEDFIARGEAHDPQLYLYKQHQIINSIKAYKDESSRARFESIYGFPPPKGGFIEIETIPDTLCDAYVSQHPELKQTRRYIEGYVQGEDDQPLADAWIACDEGIMGAATDSTGHFAIWAPRTVTKLYVRHVGYQTICHSIQPADTILNFRMKDATKIKKVKVRGKNSHDEGSQHENS